MFPKSTGPWAGKLSFWGLAIIAAIALALDLGAWNYHETYQGPFTPEEGYARQSFALPVGAERPFRCCLEVRSDTFDRPSQSDLRLWINDREMSPPHTMHAAIRNGGTPGFSHWSGSVYFSLPPVVENSPATRVTVQYALRSLPNTTIILAMLSALLGLLVYREAIERALVALYRGIDRWLNLSAGVRRDYGWINWYSFAIFISVTLLCGFFAKHGFDHGFVNTSHDGYQLRTAFDIYNGLILFKETFTQYGFITEHLNALAIYFIGERLLALKYFVAIAYGLTAVVLFHITSQLSGRVAAFLALVFWLMSAPFYRHGIMVSPHAYTGILQILALLLLLRYYDRWKFADTVWLGALTALLFLTKQNMGIYQFVGLSTFLLWHNFFIRRVAVAYSISRLAGLSIGAAVVIIPFFVWLVSEEAFGDWYKQTILFPKIFYFDYGVRYISQEMDQVWYSSFGRSFPDEVPWQLAALILAVCGAAGQPEWMIARCILLVMCLLNFGVGRTRVASVALTFLAVASLGIFPSWNFMHQWWTFEVVLPAVPSLFGGTVVLLQKLVRKSGLGPRAGAVSLLVVVLTTPVLFFRIVQPNVISVMSLFENSRRDCTTFDRLDVYRGICTSSIFQEDLTAAVDLAVIARAGDSRRRIASVETADGWGLRVQTLLVLAAVPENTSPHPVFWDLPVLSDMLYPTRREKLVSALGVLVDFTNDGVKRFLDGYKPWAYVPDRADGGGWVIYIPTGQQLPPPGRFAAPPTQPAPSR